MGATGQPRDAVEEVERACELRLGPHHGVCANLLAPTPTTPRPPQAGAPAPWSAPAVGGAEALAPPGSCGCTLQHLDGVRTEEWGAQDRLRGGSRFPPRF